jgi:hypothetical protein
MSDNPYAIKQTPNPPAAPQEILYLKVEYQETSDGYSADYDYAHSGYFALQKPDDFCSHLIDLRTNLTRVPHPLPNATTPKIRKPCYVIMAIDMNEERSLRKIVDAASSGDRVPYEYCNLVHYQDDKKWFNGNDLRPISPAPSEVDCHVVYFTAMFGSTGADDNFTLYLDDGGTLDLHISNTD